VPVFSVAGARAGLEGASGLFYQAVRIIKEMRQATGNLCPRYACMENVVGIYSSRSNGKSDFREVLNELLKIKDEAVNVPEPKNGKFLNAGAVLGDGYSVAWRTLCSSQFGVAQRRRRMFLVVDFAGERAAEILSEQEGEGRNFTPSYSAGKISAGSPPLGFGGVTCFEPGSLKRLGKAAWSEQARTIRSDCGDNAQAVAYPLDLRNAVRVGGNQGTGVGGENAPSYAITAEYQHGVAYANHSNDSRYTECKDGVFPAITKRFGDGGNNTHFVLDERKQAAPVTEDYVGALTASDYKGAAVYFEPMTMKVRCGCEGGGKGALIQSDKSGTLSTLNEQTLFQPTYAIQGNLLGRSEGNGPAGIGYREDTAYTINTVDKGGAVAYQETVGALCSSDFRGLNNQGIGDNKAIVETFGNNGHGKWSGEPATLKAQGGDYLGGENMVVENHYAVRRLTPLECLRLQGFPDFWLDNLDIQNPTEEEIDFWRKAWAELGKKKTDNQIKKFLAAPYSDSNAYKAVGNSLAVPCAIWVLRGIVDNER